MAPSSASIVMPSASAVGRLIGRLTAGILATLTVVDLAVWHSGAYESQQKAYFPWTYHQQRHLLDTAIRYQPKVLFLGNSRGRQAFKPALFDQQAHLPPDTQSCMVAPIGSPIGLSLASLRYYLRHGSPPKAVVLLIAPDDLTWSDGFVPPEAYEIFESRADWPEVTDNGKYAQIALCSVWQLWRYHKQAADLIGAALTRSPYTYERPMAPPGDATGDADYDRGWWPIIGEGNASLQPSDWDKLTDSTYLGQVAGVSALVELCRTQHIKPYFVWMPQFGHRSSDPDGQVAAAYLKRFKVDAVIDLTDVHNQESRYWQNFQHLNAEGAVGFTTALAARLGPTLQAVLQEPAATTGAWVESGRKRHAL